MTRSISRHLDDTGSAHPITRFLDAVETALDELAGASTWALSTPETTRDVTRLATVLDRLDEVEARVVGHAETLDASADLDVRSTAAWLARVTRVTRSAAARKVRLVHALRDHPQTREAMSRGEVHAEQAVVVARAVDDLAGGDTPRSPPTATWPRSTLLDQAAHFDATQLTVLGRRILEVIDPDRADEHEARLLEAQEARARKRTTLAMWDDGQGLTDGRFTVPAARGSMLRKMVPAHAAPKHVRATEGAGSWSHRTPGPRRLGHEFCELIERYPRERLPQLGGLNASVVLTVDAQVLGGARQAAHLDTGVAVTPGQLVRLACEARLLPAVLDKAGGAVLDLGRSARFHSEAQRLALLVAQQRCQAPGCDVPGAFCHVHHTTPWHHGGPATTRHAQPLCPFHHHQVHATGARHPMRT